MPLPVCCLVFQAHLHDEDFELELERLFGLPDDPDNSEDEYEGEDGIDPGMDFCSVLENRDIITPGPSRQRIVYEDESTENSNLNVGIPNVEDSEEEEILRPVRPSRISNVGSENVLSESSSESSADDEDCNGWKKFMWSEPHRPSADQFDEVAFKPKVFFPRRTSPAAYFSRFF